MLVRRKSQHWPRIGSTIIYYLIRRGIALLPFRRYAVASRLMSCRQLKLQTAVLRVPQGQWVIMPDEPATWVLPFRLKEPAIQSYLAELLDQADAFVDCGANLGWYSFLASGNHHVKSIVAVEPIYQSVRYLEFIRKLNGIRNLQIITACVSGHDGKVNLALQPGTFSEMSQVVESLERVDGRRITQRVAYTLESIIRMVDPSLNRLCIKIDVEGHESTVLGSISADTLAKRVHSVIVEVHLYKLSQPAKELDTICECLSVIGPPEFLMLWRALHSGYRRFWWHLTRRYPLPELSVAAMVEMVERHSVPEVYVLVRRDRIP